MARYGAALLLAALVAACGASQEAQREQRTLPTDTVAEADLPDPPEDVPEEDRWTVPVEQCEAQDGSATPAGILFSDEMAMRVARLRVAYDELRSLYGIDLKTWERERQVYRRYLELADEEIERANERAERTWLEKHGGQLGLGAGFVIGVAITVGIVAAMDGVTD